ncbi:MAG: hypothetical protein WB799_12900, partial [Candidatus Sulfotelmatobacter sp.]
MDAPSNEVDNSIYILAIVNYIKWKRFWVGGDWRLVSWRYISITRNIKGAHFAVGCDRSHHHLPKRSAVMNQEKYIGMDVHQAT